MAIDGKYGRVTTEFGDIGEDEPVVVFRAQDKLLPQVLAYYTMICMEAGSPRRHIDLIVDSRDRVAAWQPLEQHFTKIPESAGPAGQRYYRG